MTEANVDLDIKYRPTCLDDMVGQDEAVKIIRGFAGNVPRCLLLYGQSGTGKCLGRGTPVLMFDGTVKPVESVVVGDTLMGPDSLPRRVLSLASGRERMYRVRPERGDSYEVNESHILSLKVPYLVEKGRHKIENISVRDFLAKPRSYRMWARGWRTGVEFSTKTVPVDPYYLGLWLADGDTRTTNRIHKPDEEVRDFLVDHAGVWGLSVKNHVRDKNRCPAWATTGPCFGGQANSLVSAMRMLGVEGNKHIPHIYLANDKTVRLGVLAGLLDGDGSLNKKGICYEFANTNESIMDGVVYLARSLGMSAYKHSRETQAGKGGRWCPSFRCTISGPTHLIPCRIARKKARPRIQEVDSLLTRIEVSDIGMGSYFGFEIDGDGLFLLGDFTVTHNTTAARIIARDLGIGPFDLEEINCGLAKSAIDSVRDIQSSASLSPTSGQYRMWILDEAQTLSRNKGAAEALLTVLESSHKSAIFALCTTDPQRLLAAIKGRCVKIPLKAIKPEDLKTLVVRVAKAERLKLDDAVADKIVENAAGGARDALKELQKIMGIEGAKDQLTALSGGGAERAAFDLVKELLPYQGSPTWVGVVRVLTDIKDEDPEKIRLLVLASARTMLLKQKTKNGPAELAYKVISCLDKPYFSGGGHALLAAACFEVVFG